MSVDFIDKRRQELGLEPIIAPIFERAEARNRVIPSEIVTIPESPSDSSGIKETASKFSQLNNQILNAAVTGAVIPYQDQRTMAEKLIDSQLAAGKTYDELMQDAERFNGLTPLSNKTYIPSFNTNPAILQNAQNEANKLNLSQTLKSEQQTKEASKLPPIFQDSLVNTERLLNNSEQLQKTTNQNITGNPVLYTAMQFGAGAASPVFSITSGIAAAAKDALDGGKTSDDFQKISQYYAEHPESINVGQNKINSVLGGNGLYDYELASKMNVSPESLNLYRQSELNNNVAEVINNEVGATTPDWYKSTLGQAIYSVGAQVIPMMYTAGTSTGGKGFIDSLLDKARPSEALKTLVKPNVTTSLMGASVTGSKYTDLAKIYGADPVNFVNALATGYSEALTENLGGFTDAGSIKKLFDSRSFGKNMLKFLLTSAEEGFEEVVNVPLEGIIDKYTVNPGKTLIGSGGVFDLENMLESGVQGALVGALMGGPAAVASTTQYVRESRDARRGIEALNAVSKTSLPESMRPQAPDTKNATMEDYIKYADTVTEKIDQLAQIVKNTASTGGIRPVRLPDGSTVYVDQNNNPVSLPQNTSLENTEAISQINPNTSANVTEAGRITLKEFTDNTNPVWNFVDYSDSQTKADITQKIAGEMIQAGNVVELTDSDLSKFDQYYPDLRGMKKQERTPILRGKIKEVKNYLSNMLKEKFGGKTIEFTVNGNILEAKLHDAGIREVLEKITKTKAAMIDKTGEIFSKAQYLYSTSDKANNPDIYRWNYFYVPLKINEDILGVRIAVRDIKKANESQIYNYGIKTEATLPEGPVSGQRPNFLSDGTSVASGDAVLPGGLVNGQKPNILANGHRTASTPIIPNSSQNSNSSVVDEIKIEPSARNSVAETTLHPVNTIGSTPIIPGFSQKINQNASSKSVARTRESDGKAVTWHETEKDTVSNASRAFEEKYGIETKLAKPSKKTEVSAFLQDGKIVLNADAINTYSGTVGKIAHEATHIIQGTDAWEGAKEAALAYYKAIDPNITMKDLKQWKTEEYRGLTDLNSTQQVQEVVAGFLEDICSRNDLVGEQAARILAQENPKGFRRITQYFKDKVQSLKAYLPAGTGLNRQQRLELQAAQRGLKNLKKGLEAYQKGKVQTAQGTQYSIGIDSNGDKIVVIDTDQHLFDGKPKSEYAKIARRIINQKYKNQILPLSEYDLARVTNKSAGEYAYPRNFNFGLEYEAKNKASTELDNLLQVSEFLYHAKDTKNHPEATLGWDYYKTRFVVDGHAFEGLINIATSPNGRVFYDITNIKELPDIRGMRVTEMAQSTSSFGESLLPNSGMRVTEMAQSTSTSVGEFSNTNVPQKANSVNNSISKTSKNDTSYSYGDSSVASLMEFMNRKYGTIPEGENAYRKVAVPRQTSEGTKTRQGIRTILEAKSTPDQMAEALKQQVVEDAYAYVPVSDKNAEMQAEKTIRDRGQKGALERWNAVVNGTELANKETLALAEKLMVEAGKQGDVELFQKLAAEISAEATRAGQTVQAMRLIKKMTPEGQLYYLQKSLDSVQKDLKRRFKNKAPELEISEELAKELLEAKSQEEIDAAEQKIFVEIANQIPSTWMDKWDSWRYLAMLANPRTHIRNVLGNTVFVPARLLKNAVSMGIEHLRVGNHRLVKPENRTSAILTKSDKRLLEFAEKDFESVKESLTSSGKMNPSNRINELRRIYKTRWLETLRKANNKALDAEDMFFLKRAYTHSMARMIKSRKLDLDFLTSGSREANIQRQKIQALATQEALEATYRDASAMANALNRFKSSNPAANIFGNALFAFTKTPINVLKRGVEYSPAGLIKGVVDGISMVRSGKKTATDVVSDFSKSLSGVGISLFGYWLASMGLLSAGAPEDDKEKGFETLQGAKNYALKIGDTYYTIDWMAPVALPLFVGAELHNALEGEGFDLAAVADSLTKVSEPMFNLSMLDGINSAFKSIAYSEGNYLTDFATEAALDYISQALPTLGSQIARTIDPTVRNSYYIDKTSVIPEGVQTLLNTIQSKIPGFSYLLAPKVDQWGRTTNKENVVLRAFENFISPGYISTRKETPVDKELAEIYEETGEKSVLPSYADKSFKVDGETYRLSSKEYTEYAQAKGQLSFKLINELLSNSDYQKLDVDEKVEIIGQMYQAANAEAKKEVNSDYDIPNTVIKAYEANKQAGILYGEYYLWKMSLDSTPNMQEVIDALNRTNLTKSQKKFLFAQRFPQSNNNPFS